MPYPHPRWHYISMNIHHHSLIAPCPPASNIRGRLQIMPSPCRWDERSGGPWTGGILSCITCVPFWCRYSSIITITIRTVLYACSSTTRQSINLAWNYYDAFSMYHVVPFIYIYIYIYNTYVNVTYIHWYTVMLPTGCQLCLAIVFLSFIQLYPGRGLVF